MTPTILTALVNGAVSATVITAAVWLLLRLTPRQSWNATTREKVWWIVLMVTIALPALHLTSVFAPAVTNQITAAVSEPTFSEAPPLPIANTSAQMHDAAKRVEPTRNGTLFPIRVSAGQWPAWAMAAWAIAAALLLGRLMISYVLLGRRKSRSIDAPEEFAACVARWLESFPARRHIRMAISMEAADRTYRTIEVEVVPPRGIPKLLPFHRAGYFPENPAR